MSEPRYSLLIVDDEPEILESLRRILRGDAYRILTTTSATQALSMLEKQSVDLILSDIDMPGMSGLELITQVRKAHPEVIRMLLTGDASLASALDAINRGEVHRYLTKPWSKSELRETIRGALERSAEFRQQAAFERQSAQQRLLFEELERAFPGIGKVEYAERDTYVIDRDRIDRLVALLPDSLTRAAFAAPGSAPTLDRTPTLVETRPPKKP